MSRKAVSLGCSARTSRKYLLVPFALALHVFLQLSSAWFLGSPLPVTESRYPRILRFPISQHETLEACLQLWSVEQQPFIRHRARRADKPDRKKLGGRLERKPKEEPNNVYDWASRAFEKLVFIYERFSTREQKLKNAYSRERQDRLKQQALQQGAKSELPPEAVERIKLAPDYPGWYQDGQIIIEERDLVGVSGTKGQEGRPGFAHMIRSIERGLVGVIYVVDITRLFRDQYLINATQFVKLCSEKGVFVITESMVFDLRNDMHREIFMMQAQYASRELKMILNRLGGSRKAKAEMGKYAGDAVPVGFIVLPDEKGDRFNEFAMYEPHAKIVRLIFAKMLELRRLQAVARWCNQQSLYFPAFAPEYSYMTTRSAARGMRPMLGPGGEIIGTRILRSTIGHILNNPAYKGQFMREGKIVKDDPALAIIDPETFDAVQAILGQHAPASRAGSTSQLLAGLLFCIAHEATQFLVYCSGRTYQCAYEQSIGLTLKRCFTAASDIFDIPVSQALLGILSYADRADKIITQLEQELSERQNRAQSLRREQTRLKSERDSLFESLAYTQQEEPDPQRRKHRIKEINQKINEREEKLEELAKAELAPFENVLTTTEVTMVREFLANLGTRWDEIPNDMRNAFLRVVLDRILVEEVEDRFNLEIHWHSGFKQKLIVYRPAVSLPKTRWTEQEEVLIQQHYSTSTPEEMMRLLPRRPWDEIRRRAHLLTVKRSFPDMTGSKNPHWTDEEDQILRDFDICKIAYTEMLVLLGHRSYAGICRRARVLGIDLRKRRIVWRLVDSFEENVQSCGLRYAARRPEWPPGYGKSARSVPERS